MPSVGRMKSPSEPTMKVLQAALHAIVCPCIQNFWKTPTITNKSRLVQVRCWAAGHSPSWRRVTSLDCDSMPRAAATSDSAVASDSFMRRGGARITPLQARPCVSQVCHVDLQRVAYPCNDMPGKSRHLTTTAAFRPRCAGALSIPLTPPSLSSSRSLSFSRTAALDPAPRHGCT